MCFIICDRAYFGRNAFPGLLRNCNYSLNMDIERTILAQINLKKKKSLIFKILLAAIDVRDLGRNGICVGCGFELDNVRTW